MYDTLVITGTSCSGKSSVADALAARKLGLELVTAVTTRPARSDDAPGQYEYIDHEVFQQAQDDGELFVEGRYRGECYGVRTAAIRDVRRTGKTPMLVITPEAAKRISVDDPVEDAEFRPFVVFLDADDGDLDERARNRSTTGVESDQKQRELDRRRGDCALYTIRSGDVGDATDLISALWRTRGRGGILPRSLIHRLIACGTLLQEADDNKVESASYDLRLGDEYYHGGQIRRLSETEPILTIAQYDYAIVTSQEVVDLPRDVAGRFDLSNSLFCQGIILSNGPQVDAGFRGRLFCLLFNTSNSPILLKRRQHYATLEFHKVLCPTDRYSGHYQAKTLIDYLPTNAAQGAIHELKLELENVRKESKNLQATTWAILSLVLALIAVFVSFR